MKKLQKILSILMILVLFVSINTVNNASTYEETKIELVGNSTSNVEIPEIATIEKKIVDYNSENKEILVAINVETIKETEYKTKSLVITDCITNEAIENFNLEFVTLPSVGTVNKDNLNEGKIIWTIDELSQMQESQKIEYKLKLKEDSKLVVENKVININEKIEVSAVAEGIEKLYIIKDGKIQNVLGGTKLNLHDANNSEYTLESEYKVENGYIYIKHKNDYIVGSTLEYSGTNTIDITNYNKMVMKYRANLELLKTTGSGGYHSHVVMGVQKQLGTYTNFEKYLTHGCDTTITNVDTGVVTKELDISTIEGNTYFAISIGNCKGISELYLYDVYFQAGDIKEYNFNENSNTALEIKVTTEQNENVEDKEEDKEDNTVADTQIPQTGEKTIIVASIIIISILYIVVLGKKYNNYKDLK